MGLDDCECAGKTESHPGRQVLSQRCVARYCRKLTFGLVGPACFYASGNVGLWT